MNIPEEQLNELTDRLWNERVIFSGKGDPVIFRKHFDSAIREAVAQARRDTLAEVEQRISYLRFDSPEDAFERGYNYGAKDSANVIRALIPAVPEGYKLVPIEPTEEMCNAGHKEASISRTQSLFSYRAMLKAVRVIGN